jgi:putative FmdB family regulatory protein
MPIYDYECANCRRRFESIHGVHAPGPTSCPLCGGGPVRKAISAPAVHFKGSGWAKKERHAASTSAKKETSEAGSGSDESGAKAASTATATTVKGETSAPAADKAASDKAATDTGGT